MAKLEHVVTALFREDARIFDPSRGPSNQNPGGGLATKKRHLAQALPDIVFVPTSHDLGKVSIVDVLYFTGGDWHERSEPYIDHNGFKILWTSDFEILRWNPERREQILDATDIIAGNSTYMYKLLNSYFENRNVALLTDPVDCRHPSPKKKRTNTIYACSQILNEKGIDDVITLYKGLDEASTINKVFVGSSCTWGIPIKDVDSLNLEMQIEEVCDTHAWSLPYKEVEEYANNAWIFVSFAKFETFGYAVAEAMLGGCTVFAYPHNAYKDRIEAGVIIPIPNPETATKQIIEWCQTHSRVWDPAAVQYVIDTYSLDVFRKQLKNIIGTLYGI